MVTLDPPGIYPTLVTSLKPPPIPVVNPVPPMDVLNPETPPPIIPVPPEVYVVVVVVS